MNGRQEARTASLAWYEFSYRGPVARTHRHYVPRKGDRNVDAALPDHYEELLQMDLPEEEGETERQRERRERFNRVNSYLRRLLRQRRLPD